MRKSPSDFLLDFTLSEIPGAAAFFLVESAPGVPVVPAVAGCCFAGAVVLADFCDDAQALNKVTPMAAMITDLFIITKFWLLNIIAVRVGQAFFRINAKIFVSNGVY